MADVPNSAPVPAQKLGIIDYVKMLFNGRAAVEEAIAEGKIIVAEAHTAGVRTIGFWAVLLAGIASVALQTGGLVPPPWGAIVLSVAAAVYAVSRGMIKQDDPVAGLKPFASTSEAWLNIAAAISAAFMAVKGVVSPQTALILGSVNAVMLSVADSLAGSGAQPGDNATS